MADEIIQQEAQASIINFPKPTKEKDPRQKSFGLDDLFLTRWTPPWSRPPSMPAYAWRMWVMNQPVAEACKETLISTNLSLDWKVVARNSQYREELAPVARYYTKLIDQGGFYLGGDYTTITEWVMGDLLDLPFGGAVEVGRKGDTPDGRVQWLRPLDGGTLYPTLNDAFPVVQYYQGWDTVAFPAHAISRTFMSPHQTIFREGWGIAPPEKIYFALDMLNRGDKYYANLLLDVPPAGILDLGDMEKDSALEWVESFKTFMNGVTDAYKVPVMYEHTKDIKFVPFGKVPNDIMYDHITERYINLLCAGYGLSSSDIGIQSGGKAGASLAGVIRQERKSRITGRAKIKSKMEYFWNSILPDSLMFKFIDFDEEATLSMGRARLASATAFNMYRQMGVFSKQEVRSQSIQDGLFDLNVPEELPADAAPEPIVTPAPFGNTPKKGKPIANSKTPNRPAALGSPTPVSGGGEGDLRSIVVKSKTSDRSIKKIVDTVSKSCLVPLFTVLSSVSEDDLEIVKSQIQDTIFDEYDEFGLQGLLVDAIRSKSPFDIQIPEAEQELKQLALFDMAPDLVEKTDWKVQAERLQKSVNDGLVNFLAKSVLVTLSEVEGETIFDSIGDVNYDYIQQETQERIMLSLADFVKAHVQAEAENIIMEIKSMEMENE